MKINILIGEHNIHLDFTECTLQYYIHSYQSQPIQNIPITLNLLTFPKITH